MCLFAVGSHGHLAMADYHSDYLEMELLHTTASAGLEHCKARIAYYGILETISQQ